MKKQLNRRFLVYPDLMVYATDNHYRQGQSINVVKERRHLVFRVRRLFKGKTGNIFYYLEEI